MSTIIEELAENVLDSRYETLSQEVVGSAKNRIIDVVGCLIAGANAPGCGMIVDLIREWGGREEASVLVYGGKVPAHNAAMLNSIMARSYDYEVCCVHVGDAILGSHIAATTVPTAIALAEQRCLSGKELIAALILGDDVASRVTVASDFAADQGWDITGTLNMFGTTAIAGRLLGLNKRQLQNAFGIVLNEMAGSFQGIWDAVHCFKLLQGRSARAGIFAAKLASKGFTGIKDALLSQHGYFSLYCRSHHPAALTQKLGREFYAEDTFKPYPGCRFLHSSIDAALKVIHEHDINVGDIGQVTVGISPRVLNTFVGKAFEVGEVPQVSAAFSIRYAVANVLVRKSMGLQHFTERFVRDPVVVDLAKRIELVGETSQGELGAAINVEKTQRATLKVKVKSGEEFFGAVDIAKGDPIHCPLTEEEVRQKFRNNVAFSKTVTEKNAEEALNLLDKLEEIDNLADIIRLLRV
jgi:2-methylcitrate dehydratase PrpD